MLGADPKTLAKVEAIYSAANATGHLMHQSKLP
jgi:hypothetical protein